MVSADVVIVGAGFYGLSLADYFSSQNRRVVILEESEPMQRASLNNQARIHRGYHYPRSFLTAVKSSVSFGLFCERYPEATLSTYKNYYAVAKSFSKVNSQQFKNFMTAARAPLKPASAKVKAVFDSNLIEDVFETEESVFDAVILKKLVLDKLNRQNVVLLNGCRAERILQKNKVSKTTMLMYSKDNQEQEIEARYIFNCTYGRLNYLLSQSGYEKIPIKYEITEMPLIDPLKALDEMAITLMCGPFFSMMPYPTQKKFTLSHVRLTPHLEWTDSKSEPKYQDPYLALQNYSKKSHFVQMAKDVQRYFKPKLDFKSDRSIWEVKAILPQSEVSDSRPILFKRSLENANVVSVLGGKIDNDLELINFCRKEFHYEE